ncbi:hypothetical protein PRZ48_005138 [Zasmidium cellare]|uniref:Uncharacterized protein n=1 Tax=Zasmidium cellare TaxID=395010 RepID=A0ABR0ERR8_ZASCE|nr:hypothetical protein PRZ48_005138 [Zasmidium cellare]
MAPQTHESRQSTEAPVFDKNEPMSDKPDTIETREQPWKALWQQANLQTRTDSGDFLTHRGNGNDSKDALMEGIKADEIWQRTTQKRQPLIWLHDRGCFEKHAPMAHVYEKI